MNEIYLSGRVTAMSNVNSQAEGSAAHCILQISVAHRTRAGEARSETFAVHAWNNLARWAQNSIALGSSLMIRGYLSLYGSGDKRRAEATATHFFRCMEGMPVPVSLAVKKEEPPQQEGGEADGRELADHP